MTVTHGIRIRGSQFWVIHRRLEYGPFDYEWSKDFCGIEFLYRGHKFGEYCSADELFADLKSCRLPRRVFEVASIAMGTMVRGMLNGRTSLERAVLLEEQLVRQGLSRYALIDRDEAR